MGFTSPAVAALILASISACTLLSDFSVQQCESSADCDVLDGSIRRCVQSQCVDGCENNHHCNQFDPRAPICPAPGAQCESLTSDDGSCYVSSAYDDATMGGMVRSDLTLVGAFAPTLKSSTWLTLALGADELNAAASAETPALPPTLVVLCHGGDDAVPSMKHLVGRLGVRGVVAALEAVPLEAVREQKSLLGQALLLSSNAADAPPEGEDARLLWYLGGRDDDAVAAYPGLMRRLQDIIEPSTSPPRGMRIAAVVGDAREDIALFEAVKATIQIDGRTADYLFREDRFRRFQISDDSLEERAQLPVAITAYAPDVLLVFAGGELRVPRGAPRLAVVSDIAALVGDGAAWSPFYVLGPRAVDDAVLAQLAAKSAQFRARAVGITTDRGSDARRADGLLARYSAAFPEASASGLFPAANNYDALYYLVYATGMARARAPVVTADGLLDGLARVADFRGDCIDVGPDGIVSSFEHIRDGTPFQLCTITGSARFTPDHARSGQWRAFCWPAAGATVDAPHVLSAGVTPTEPRCATDFPSLAEAP